MENQLLDCKMDDANTVITPQLHDSNLTKLEFFQDNIVLSFILESKKVINIHLIGIVDIMCNNLRKGNIVLDVTASTGSDTDFYLLDKLFTKPKVNNPKFESYLCSLKNKILQNELYVVQLNPSYGCEIIALCENIKYSTKR